MPRKKDLPYKTEGDIFATRLREIMEERKTNQTKLSAQIKEEQGKTLQRQTISQYMNGQSKPDTERLAILCNALGVSSDWLIGRPGAVKCVDATIQAACSFTGLTPSGVMAIRKLTTECGFSALISEFFSLDNGLAYFRALSELEKAVDSCDGWLLSVWDKGPGERSAFLGDLIKRIQFARFLVTDSVALAGPAYEAFRLLVEMQDVLANIEGRD